MYSIEWTNCEPTLANIWHNIVALDPTYNLQTMMMVMGSYYKFHEHKVSPRDLELELRKRNLNTGLIAIDWTKDPDYKKIVDERKGAIIQLRYMHLYTGGKAKCLDDINPGHLAKYVTITSCRPRELVIEETLSHSFTIETNLEKLETAGNPIIFGDDPRGSIADVDNISLIKQNKSNHNIQDGTKLVKVMYHNLKAIFETALEENPECQVITLDGLNGAKTTFLNKFNESLFPICRVTTPDGEEKYLCHNLPQYV
jgi:hypothetical protein